MAKTQKQIENCLFSELSNMISEIELERLTVENALSYFSSFLIDAGINSRIVVNVLEEKRFGELGKEAARNIKVNEGW